MKKYIFLFAICFSYNFVNSQNTVTIDVQTDDYGYEIYWQLLPTGNACGTGTIFAGGNTAVGCGGAGLQLQAPGGYGDNITITEGPWILTTGATYDIFYADDWGDFGATFTVYIDGFPVYSGMTGSGDAPGTTLSFTVNPPLAYDMAGEHISTFNYVNIGNVDISGHLFNRSSNTITSLDLNYQIDSDPIVTSTISSLSIAPFTECEFIHPTQWNAITNGTYNVKVWASNLNGNPDMDITNDTVQKSVIVGPGIPNIINTYVGINTPQATVIATASEGILVPRDLDFHPTLTNYDCWVILKSTEALGGKTVKISNAGLVSQTELVQQDDNAYHFMSLPTGIAFSENGNFATSPGVFDANHDGGTPYTGPTLWSSDPSIYAMPSGGNGSHLDMLHESPFSMGIAHEVNNAFWLNDAQNGVVSRFDFKEDHGPGNSFHGDGTVRRYTGLGLVEESTKHVTSHLVLDKATNWLYIVDTGNDRVLRMDITTGSATGTFTPMEAISEASVYTGFTSSTYISTGLSEPSGIDIIGDRLIVSDHTTGEIIIYDCSGATGVELERLQVQPGVMGVKIGPDGNIWYVNATTNEVVRLAAIESTNVEENFTPIAAYVYPNPIANGNLNINTNINGSYKINVIDVMGQIISSFDFNSTKAIINTNEIPAGNYFIQIIDAGNNILNKKFIIAK